MNGGHHEHGGWGSGGGGWGGDGGWGNPRWGGGWGGGGWGGRRSLGFPLLGGLGMGGGGGLIGNLLAGGVGYLMGRNSSQNQPQYQQTTPQYQPAGGVQNSQLAQLNLLGQLRAQGTLTEEEFQAQKQKILNGY